MVSVMPDHRGYQTVNLIFIVMILLVFGYSLAYPPAGGHPVHSFYTVITGKRSPTAGLSRSFSAIMRGDLSLARNLSPYGLPLFLFLVIQLAMRTTALVLLKKHLLPQRWILTGDVILSVILFLLCYGSLLHLLLEKIPLF